MVKIRAEKRIQKIQGGQAIPFAKGRADDPCPPGEHVERIYFPDVDYAEQSPDARIRKMEEAGQDPFEIAAANHNIKKGHIANGRQISRKATPQELEDGRPGNWQCIKAVCVKCGKWREIDHVENDRSVVEAKALGENSKYASVQRRNNQVLVERGFQVSYKIPRQNYDFDKVGGLRQLGFEVVLVRFP